MTASITGALIAYIAPDHPGWAPHRTVTHAEAIAALTRHLKRDCISTGPLFHSNRISGNFFTASAGFCIEDPTSNEAQQVAALMDAYEASEHAHIYRQLQAIYEAQKAETDRREQRARDTGVPSYQMQKIRLDVNRKHMAQWKPLEVQLESIYRANQPASTSAA